MRFSVNIPKILRTAFSIEHLRWLLLNNLSVLLLSSEKWYTKGLVTRVTCRLLKLTHIWYIYVTIISVFPVLVAEIVPLWLKLHSVFPWRVQTGKTIWKPLVKVDWQRGYGKSTRISFFRGRRSPCKAVVILKIFSRLLPNYSWIKNSFHVKFLLIPPKSLLNKKPRWLMNPFCKNS